LGPDSEYPSDSSNQAPGVGGRQRSCLLKGCERPFHSLYALARYCSDACRAAARRWSQWRANQRYGASEQGKSRRVEQSRRWRERARQASQNQVHEPVEASCSPSSEGYQKGADCEKFCCSRPGCYEQFIRTLRSPLQKFCSSVCRQALRRVLRRESRWRSLWARMRCGKDSSHASGFR
jgi:hypothetical protein